jgi:hypothetical protein
MKDAGGHGSNPRGGTAAHATGVDQVGKKFHTATPAEFLTARSQSAHPEMFTPHQPGDFARHTLLMDPTGKLGAAVSPEGDIQSVFNNSGIKGAGGAAIEAAKAAGGKTLDAFDPVLPGIYKKHGFVETGRAPFDPAQAPPGWKNGTPDVVFMKLKGAK